MIVCFRCTAETKAHLDRLLASGAYQSYDEAITTAIRNQVIMEQEVAENGALVIGDPESATPAAPPLEPLAQTNGAKTKPAAGRHGKSRLDKIQTSPVTRP